MSKRGPGPTLYDLIKGNDPSPGRGFGRRPTVRTPVPEPEPRPEDPVPSPTIAPGRTVTLPSGYLFIIGAIVVAAAAGGWMLGYQRGVRHERTAAAERFIDAQGSGESLPDSDPLDAAAADRTMPTDRTDGPRVVEPPAGRGRRGEAATPSSSSPSAGQPSRAGTAPAGWPPIDQPPRIAGHRYFVLATTRPDGARRLATFCRSEGLETYVVPVQGGRFAKVIAFPGLEDGSSDNPARRRLEATIRQVGQKWKNDHRGATDFSDAYTEIHRP